MQIGKQARKDAAKLVSAGLREKTRMLLTIVASNSYQNPPQDEKLTRDLVGYYSRGINIQHRLVYQVLAETRVIKVLRMWSHYE